MARQNYEEFAGADVRVRPHREYEARNLTVHDDREWWSFVRRRVPCTGKGRDRSAKRQQADDFLSSH